MGRSIIRGTTQIAEIKLQFQPLNILNADIRCGLPQGSGQPPNRFLKTFSKCFLSEKNLKTDNSFNAVNIIINSLKLLYQNI